VIHIDSEGVDGLLARARAGTDRVHVVDGGTTRAEVLARFADVLDFPEWFGGNLDALMDCLRDVADRHEDPWTLVWAPGDTEPDGGADPGVLGVLSSLEEEYPGVSVVVADR